jgi:hypothetical protein
MVGLDNDPRGLPAYLEAGEATAHQNEMKISRTEVATTTVVIRPA